MSAFQYDPEKNEFQDFINNAQEMKAKMNSLMQYGKIRLKLGMKAWKDSGKPTFDPKSPTEPYPYAEKNFYINAANQLWLNTVWDYYSQISEIYYSSLLEQIKEFSKQNGGFNFNKGIVYGNLGVAQSDQMKLDEGFANILKALIDDAPYSRTTPQSNLWKSPLFVQFEKQYVRTPLTEIVNALRLPGIPVADTFVDTFLNSLTDDLRAFFEYTFIEIKNNYSIWEEKENGLSSNRILAYTQDLCLFNEAFLKSKFAAPNQHWLLDTLIKNAGFRVNLDGCGASTMVDLGTKLSSLSGVQPRKCLRMLLTLRNYSSHNVGGGAGTDYFYSHFKEILEELIRATCEFALLPQPILFPSALATTP